LISVIVAIERPLELAVISRCPCAGIAGIRYITLWAARPPLYRFYPSGNWGKVFPAVEFLIIYIYIYT
jgi:hypothetical protein